MTWTCRFPHARNQSRLLAERDHIHQLDRCLTDEAMPLDLRVGELPAAVLADLTGISVSTAERWSQWAKRDWAAYVGQRTADDHRDHSGGQKLTNRTR